jgi:tetratricopeptide (TPR) repeat protein
LARDTHEALRASAETLEAVLALQPNHPVARALDAQARALLAATYGDGDVAGARRLVDAADQQVEPGAVLTARRALARDEAERRAVDEATLAAPPGRDPGLDSLAGVVLLSRGQTAPAIERFNAAIAAGAGHAPTFVRVGDYYRSRGEHEDALRYYALALAVAEDHPGAVLGTAESRLATAADPASLREALAGLDRLTPAGAVPVADRARLALLRSRILSALDDRAGAVAALRGVEDLIGEDREGRVALANATGAPVSVPALDHASLSFAVQPRLKEAIGELKFVEPIYSAKEQPGAETTLQPQGREGSVLTREFAFTTLSFERGPYVLGATFTRPAASPLKPARKTYAKAAAFTVAGEKAFAHRYLDGLISREDAVKLAAAQAGGAAVKSAETLLITDEAGTYKWWVNLTLGDGGAVKSWFVDPYFARVWREARPFTAADKGVDPQPPQDSKILQRLRDQNVKNRER